jgi:hypothetical protein
MRYRSSQRKLLQLWTHRSGAQSRGTHCLRSRPKTPGMSCCPDSSSNRSRVGFVQSRKASRTRPTCTAARRRLHTSSQSCWPSLGTALPARSSFRLRQLTRPRSFLRSSLRRRFHLRLPRRHHLQRSESTRRSRRPTRSLMRRERRSVVPQDCRGAAPYRKSYPRRGSLSTHRRPTRAWVSTLRTKAAAFPRVNVDYKQA